MNAEHRAAATRERRIANGRDTAWVRVSPGACSGMLVGDSTQRRNEVVRSWEALQRTLKELER
jgi:hypothetical protein